MTWLLKACARCGGDLFIDESYDPRPQSFEGMDVDVDVSDPVGQVGKTQAGFDPVGEIIRRKLRLQTRLDEMIIERIAADRRKDLAERLKIISKLVCKIDEPLDIVQKKRLIRLMRALSRECPGFSV